MGLIAIAEASKLLENTPANITEADKEFITQFALRATDQELTNKLIDELCTPAINRDSIRLC